MCKTPVVYSEQQTKKNGQAISKPLLAITAKSGLLHPLSKETIEPQECNFTSYRGYCETFSESDGN